MIVDKIENAARYFGLSPRLEEALRYIAATDFSVLERGSYDVKGDEIFTKVRVFPDGGRDPESCVWEGHRRYLDIHYVQEGIERFGYADAAQMREIDYDEEKDHANLEGIGDMLTVYPGTFIITDINDIHLPCVRDRQLPPLKKIVVKVKIK